MKMLQILWLDVVSHLRHSMVIVVRCTGLIIDCIPVRILTSASLVKISGDENKIDDNLQVGTGSAYHCLCLLFVCL